jgi:hypothetical protein
VGAPHAELELLGQPRATLSSRTCDTASFAERASRPFHSQRVRIEGALPMGRAGFEPATDGLCVRSGARGCLRLIADVPLQCGIGVRVSALVCGRSRISGGPRVAPRNPRSCRLGSSFDAIPSALGRSGSLSQAVQPARHGLDSRDARHLPQSRCLSAGVVCARSRPPAAADGSLPAGGTSSLPVVSPSAPRPCWPTLAAGRTTTSTRSRERGMRAVRNTLARKPTHDRHRSSDPAWPLTHSRASTGQCSRGSPLEPGRAPAGHPDYSPRRARLPTSTATTVTR